MRALLVLGLLLVLAGGAHAAPGRVQAGVLVLGYTPFDEAQGAYNADFYAWFRWNASELPANYSATTFELVNGVESKRTQIVNGTLTDGRREAWFRVSAEMRTTPRLADYPYDVQSLHVAMEDAAFNSTVLVFVPDSASGVSPETSVPGWRVSEVDVVVSEHYYPTFDESYSQLAVAVLIDRPPTFLTLKLFAPPVVFVLISAVSFFLHPSKSVTRITLGTGMLVNAVIFHQSQTARLPSSAGLTLYDAVNYTLDVFLIGSLLTSLLIALDEDWWKERDLTGQINRWGLAISIAGTVGVGLGFAAARLA